VSPGTLLNVEDLRTHLQTDNGVVRAVDHVSLMVRADETVALVGESGCGKTMTALSVMRLLPATARILSGTIYFEDRNLLEMSFEELRRIRGSRMAMIYQDPMTFLNPILRIGKQVAEVLLVHEKIGRAEARQRVLEVFDLLGIPSPARVFESYPHQLSGGMRQRVIIAMAIVCHPALLVADEPTTALDVSIQAQIMELLKETRKKLRNSLLLISHDLGLVAENCDRAYVMYAGRVVEHADIVTIFRNPQHPYTKGLLRSNLSPDRRAERFETIEGEVANLISPPPGCPFHPRCTCRIDMCDKQFPPMAQLPADHVAWCWLLQ
jgi:oligopeptide/dipeptide ABC transporter ATP-binding protein